MASFHGRERSLPFCVSRCKSVKELMAILGGGQRLEIILTLVTAGGPLTVQTLMDLLCLDSPMVSKNLRILREHGLVEYRPHKKLRWYQLASCVSVTPDGECLRVFDPLTSRPELVFRIPRPIPEPVESSLPTPPLNGQRHRYKVSVPEQADLIHHAG